MVSDGDVIIYPADQRSCSQEEWFRSYYTLNSGEFERNGRPPIGNLLAINDHTLKAGNTIKLSNTENTTILLIPIVGKLDYKFSANENTLDVGSAAFIILPEHHVLQISNPYQGELINFLQVSIRYNTGQITNERDYTCSFELDDHKNQLIALSNPDSSFVKGQFFLGKYDGRREGTFALHNPNGAFVYIIDGTFEVQHRLLLPRDGLSLRNVSEITFEALTQEAVILIVDMD